jgi:hypothetical protein
MHPQMETLCIHNRWMDLTGQHGICYLYCPYQYLETELDGSGFLEGLYLKSL